VIPSKHVNAKKNRDEQELQLPRRADRDPVERSQFGIGSRNPCEYCTSKEKAGQYKNSKIYDPKYRIYTVQMGA
jgi:hypothetical protein